jgi:hypothetical protein
MRAVVPFDQVRYDRFQDLLAAAPPPHPSAIPRAMRRATELALPQLAHLKPDPVLLRR